MWDGYGLMLSIVQRIITYGIGWLLYDWNNGILLRKNQHKRITQDTRHLCKSFIQQQQNDIFFRIASLASMVVTALSIDVLKLRQILQHVQSFIRILRFQSYRPVKSCSSWSETFVLVLTLSLVSRLTSSVKNYYVKWWKSELF